MCVLGLEVLKLKNESKQKTQSISQSSYLQATDTGQLCGKFMHKSKLQ